MQNLFKQSVREKRYKKLDLFVTVSFILMLIFSCVMIYSASMIGNKYGIFTNYRPVSPNYFFIRQFIWAIISLISYLFFAMYVPFEVFKNKKIYYRGFFVILALLIMPFLQGSTNGAYSWIRIFGFSFQTSVLAQIFLIAYMAFILNAKKYTLMKSCELKELTKPFFVPLLILFFIFIQNDTGTMLITGTIVIVMVLCSNISFKNILLLIKIGALSIILLILFLFIKSSIFPTSSYKINRFKIFLNPFYGVSDSNNQIVNSLIAFGNGGLFGRGLGNSIQKLGYLSEAHTDFILAITAEELGLFGVLLLICLLLTIILKIVYTGLKANNTFESLFSIGFATLITVQTIVNIGGITASMPMTGVPIPFFSYGGSSLLILSTTLGIIMNLLSHIKYKNSGN